MNGLEKKLDQKIVALEERIDGKLVELVQKLEAIISKNKNDMNQ